MSHKGNDYLIDDLMDREVKKPEKKIHKSLKGLFGKNRFFDFDKGYNQACDEWENFLPSESEVINIMLKGVADNETFINIAKAISKQIRG